MTSKNNLKLFVFDLDYTLWPFWVDTHVTPPFRKLTDGKVVDRHGSRIKYYPEVPEVLEDLKNQGYSVAVASRTSEIEGAKQLIELFGWDKYIQYQQIFPGCKVTHFNNLKRETNFKFNEMIFFDDEDRNIRDISNLGVVSIFVKNGVTKQVIESGISKYLSTHK